MSLEVSKKKILIIEDEPTQRILSKEFLEAAGYGVRLSDDGKHGLNMAMKIKPDLIMLDLMLPSVDGYSLCRFLKDAEQTADVPIILVTASKEPDVIKRGLEAGADDFVTKPVDWQFLKDRVAFVLSQAEQKREADSFDYESGNGVVANDEDAGREERELLERELQDVRAAYDAAKVEVREAEQAHAQALQNIKEASESALERAEASLAAQMTALSAQHEEELNRVSADWTSKLSAREAEFVDELRAIEELKDRELELASEKALVAGAVETEFQDERLAVETQLFDERVRAMWAVVGESCSHFEGVLEKIVTQEMADNDELSAEEHSARLVRQVKYLAHSVGRLGKLSSVFTDGSEGADDVFDAHAFLTSHVEDFGRFAERRGVAVGVDATPNALEVRCDLQKLRHAVGLLSLHALREMPETEAILFGADVGSNGEIRLSVVVSGDVLSEEKCQSWANCLTVPSAAIGCETESLNLYVPTVAAIVQRCGGHIEVESYEETGTAVTIVLPQVDVGERNHETAEAEALEHVA